MALARASPGKGKNSLRWDHTREWMRAIKTGAIKGKIGDSVVRALTNGIRMGRDKDGRFYRTPKDPVVVDLRFCFVGRDFRPTAPAAHNLTTEGLYHVRCECGTIDPVVEVYLFHQEEEKTFYLRISHGEVKIYSKEVGYQDLLRKRRAR